MERNIRINTETQREILLLRAQGNSFAKIAKQAGVGKQTAVDVCRQNEETLASLKAFELEELYETQRITYKARVKAFASLMRKLGDEIANRDLQDVATDKLIDLYLKTFAALKDELITPTFKSEEEQEQDRQEREMLNDLADLGNIGKQVINAAI